jgi:hypothetical protein
MVAFRQNYVKFGSLNDMATVLSIPMEFNRQAFLKFNSFVNEGMESIKKPKIIFLFNKRIVEESFL